MAEQACVINLAQVNHDTLQNVHLLMTAIDLIVDHDFSDRYDAEKIRSAAACLIDAIEVCTSGVLSVENDIPQESFDAQAAALVEIRQRLAVVGVRS